MGQTIWAGTQGWPAQSAARSNWLSKEDVTALLHLTGWEFIPLEPDELPKFYDAVVSGLPDFVNGSRPFTQWRRRQCDF
jgi:hypothetical protein